MERKAHWNAVYDTRSERDVSWFETLPDVSLRLMEAAGLNSESCVIDVGGGDSHLVDALADRGLDCLAVLDLAGAALDRARNRLGTKASIPIWIEADVAGEWSLKPMDIWHDRAVFHFLIDPHDRTRYGAHLRQTLRVVGPSLWRPSPPMVLRNAAGYQSCAIRQRSYRGNSGRICCSYRPWPTPT